MSWVKKKYCNTKLERNPTNAAMFELVDRAVLWLRNNTYMTVIVKWEKIQASQQANFDILNFDTFNLPYDWASISHFRSKAYRTQKSVGHTIESKVS